MENLQGHDQFFHEDGASINFKSIQGLTDLKICEAF